MTRSRFCSSCGEKLKVSRQRAWLFACRCAGCAPRERAGFLTLLVLFALLTAGFLAGRLTARNREVKFIGTPVDLAATPDNGAGGTEKPPAAGDAREEEVEEVWAMCGAPTKSDRPCRRKVRGGGPCWQHRQSVSPQPGKP